MKTFIIFILYIAIIFVISAFKDRNEPKEKNDLTEMKLMGKVKTLKNMIYYYDEEYFQKPNTAQVFLYNFNDSGNIIFEEYNPSEMDTNFIKNNYNYQYDSIGNLTGKEMFSNGILIEQTIYKFDEKNKIIKQTTNRNYGKYSDIKSIEFKYDIEGRIIEKRFIEIGIDNYILKYKYDKKGNKILV